VRPLFDDVTARVKPRNLAAVTRRQADVVELRTVVQLLRNSLTQGIEAEPRKRGNGHDILTPLRFGDERVAFLRLQQVDLVPGLDLRLGRLVFRPTPNCASTPSTSSRCASRSGCAMSRTWMSRSAEATSSSVARNAATNCVGSSETNPTVSDRIALSKPGSLISRIVGSSVAKSIFSARTSPPVIRLKSVDFPAFV
jgi:hypothetical protein